MNRADLTRLLLDAAPRLTTLPPRGLDVRIREGALDLPEYAELTANAFALLQAATLYSQKLGLDGFLPERWLTASGRYPGLPWIRLQDVPAALDELEAAGLVVRVSGGVVVPWDWQTTAAKIANERERKRINQKDYRERENAKKDAYELGVAAGKIRPIA